MPRRGPWAPLRAVVAPARLLGAGLALRVARLPWTGGARPPRTGGAGPPGAGGARLPWTGVARLPRTGVARLPWTGVARLPWTGVARLPWTGVRAPPSNRVVLSIRRRASAMRQRPAARGAGWWATNARVPCQRAATERA